MISLDSMSVAEKVIAQIRSRGGAFLTVQAGNDLNVMTIGWATIGFVWGRPIMSILVRNSRHTYGIIERAPDFTLSVPLSAMDKELAFCGTKSGKTENKFKQCNLEVFPSVKVASPIIRCEGIHFECRIVCRTPMDPQLLIEDYQKLYPKKDYHTVYYGEIKECYSTDGLKNG